MKTGTQDDGFPCIEMTVACAPRVPDEPPVDLATEAAVIQRLNTEVMAAEGRRDIDAVLAFAGPDILLQPAGGAEIRGLLAVRQFYEAFFKLPIASLTGGSLETEVARSGDLAYDIGWNRVQLSEPPGVPADSEKHLSIWRKLDGEWKIVAVAFSSNGPAPK